MDYYYCQNCQEEYSPDEIDELYEDIERWDCPVCGEQLELYSEDEEEIKLNL